MSSTTAIASGPVTQIAWVTDDIAATETLLSSAFGVGRWTRMNDMHFGPETCTVGGRPADFVAHISLAYAADMQLELIQPVSGTSIYSDFLEQSAPGLHHVCFDVEDMDAALERAAELGLEVLQGGSMMDGQIRFAYLDGSSAGAPYIELAQIGPEMRALYDAVKSASHAGTAD